MNKKLSSKDRDFFLLVRDATFTNPFSDERADIDRKITGLPKEIPEKKRVEILTQVVLDRLHKFDPDKKIPLDSFSGEDRELMKTVFLFAFFHQFLNRFDEMIPEQIRAGDSSVKVPFSREALSILQEKGFRAGEARHYFALCYQIRRAFYFIDHSLIGRSPCMKQLRRNLWNNVFTRNIGLYDAFMWNRMEDFSTLLLGETGTGKGTAAMSIGRSGFIPFDEKTGAFRESFVRSFVSLNLSQFPETLIESELFGHRKGAFTGASEDFRGVFDRCSPHGSIFLDEIGEISEPVQIKLLQVLQERIYSPVGSHQTRRFQGRVIGATNRNISDLREKKRMRNDFFYRLSSDIITVPPLRRRIQEDPKELDDLLSLTIERILGAPSDDLVQMILDIIIKDIGRDYPWPGNVRELEQCVRRILMKGAYEGDFRQASADLNTALTARMNDGDIDAQRLLAGYCRMLHERFGTYEAVARRTGLDRRTAKKYIETALKEDFLTSKHSPEKAEKK